MWPAPNHEAGAEFVHSRLQRGAAYFKAALPRHHARFLEWLLPLLVQVLVAGPLQHPPSSHQESDTPTMSWVNQ